MTSEAAVYQTRLSHHAQPQLFKNTSAEEVPPFGVMQISGNFERIRAKGRYRIPIIKPNELGESAQDPLRMMFNLGRPVAAGATGLGVLDGPAFASVEAAVDEYMMPAGPIRNSWDLKYGGLAFIVRGFETAAAAGERAYVQANTCRLANAVVGAGAAVGTGTGAAIVAGEFTAELLRRDGTTLGHATTGIILQGMNDFADEAPADGTFVKLAPEPNGKWSLVVWPC